MGTDGAGAAVKMDKGNCVFRSDMLTSDGNKESLKLGIM